MRSPGQQVQRCGIDIDAEKHGAYTRALVDHLTLRLGEYRAADLVRRAREVLRTPAPALA